MRAHRLRVVPAQGQGGGGWAGARFLLPPRWGGSAHDGQAIELHFSRTLGWSAEVQEMGPPELASRRLIS